MRAALFGLAILALCGMLSLVEAYHIKTVFQIPLGVGPSNTEFYTAGVGNTYYTVGQGGKLFAVDLTTKSILWHREFAGDAITGMQGLAAGSVEILLISLNDVTMALNNKSQLMWVTSAFDTAALTTPNQWTVSGNYLFVIANSQFSAIDLTTGIINSSIPCTSGQVFPNEAILQTQTAGGTNQLVAYALPSMTQKWSLAVEAFLAQNSKYLVVAYDNSNAGYTEALVLNPNTLDQIAVIRDVTGIVSDQFAEIINENFLLAKIGSNQDWAYFDLRTGNKLWQITPDGTSSSSLSASSENGGGSGSATDSNAIATPHSIILLSGLGLHFINISNGMRMGFRPNVPVTEEGTITLDFHGSVANVWNLQGYTSWSTLNGQFLGSNEMDPSPSSSSTSTSYLWENKYYVSTRGAYVIGQIIVP
jgi:hypothetical protein